MIKAIPMEDWLRGCVYHDGRHGEVTLPTDKVLKIANYIQRTRRSTTDGLIDLAVVEADRKTEPKQEWIPCSERLPSDGQCVIIQYFDTVGKNHISVVGAYYNERQGFVDTGYGEMWFGNGNDDVLAWMPLPKPWKGADDETD